MGSFVHVARHIDRADRLAKYETLVAYFAKVLQSKRQVTFSVSDPWRSNLLCTRDQLTSYVSDMRESEEVSNMIW